MIRAILEEYAGIIAIAVLTAVVAYLATYQVITIHNICITNLKYVKLLPWAYAYYNGTKIVLWVTNPGLISFTVEKVIADNGLILLDHPVGPVSPGHYTVLKFPYMRIRKVPSARIYRLTLDITFRGDNDVTDRVVVLAESYYGTNRIEKIVKVVKTEGYVHYIQNSTNIVTLFFEDCSHCDFDYRDLVLSITNLGQRLVLYQESEKGGYAHWLYINNTLINYKPPDAEQEGKEWTYKLKLVETRYTTRKIILYRPKWLTIVACVPHEHICKQFTTPIWNITITTEATNQTTNTTNKKLSWYVPHTFSPPGYATIYISITPPTTPTYAIVKIEYPGGNIRTILLSTKVAIPKYKEYNSGPWTIHYPSYSIQGDYAVIYAPLYMIYYIPDEIVCYGGNLHLYSPSIARYYYFIMNGTKIVLINQSNTRVIIGGNLELTVPIGTVIRIYTPSFLYGWHVTENGKVLGDIIVYKCNWFRGERMVPKTIRENPVPFTEYAFLGYLGPLVNGLVRRNKITITVNKSGYILITYVQNPNTVNIKVKTKLTNVTKLPDYNTACIDKKDYSCLLPYEYNEIKRIPIAEIYYTPPSWETYRQKPTFIIDVIHLLAEDTVKAQVNSTIKIHTRKTITYVFCYPCHCSRPPCCGHGPCWLIEAQLQNKTKITIHTQKPTTITITYTITNITKILPSTCTHCPPLALPPNIGSVSYGQPYYKILDLKAVLNGGCSPIEECVPVTVCVRGSCSEKDECSVVGLPVCG